MSTLSETQPRTTVSLWHRWLFYSSLCLAANGLLWGVALFYVRTIKPTYVSEWAITLPSAGSSTNVNIPNIGNASATVNSPYDNANTRDPRENYKFIITSEPVINEAADSLGMSPSEFGQPRVQIIANTTLMSFEVAGDNPNEAKQKSVALYNAFEEILRELRIQEVSQKNEGVQAALGEAENKLKQAQTRLSQYQAQTGLTSNVQLEQLSSNIEELRREQAILIAQLEQADARLGQLSSNLRVSAQQAAEAFSLNSDSLFQQNLKTYSEAAAAIDALRDQLGPNHPTMMREVTRRNSAQSAMLARAREILGRSVSMATLSQLNIGTAERTTERGELFQDTVVAQVDRQGLVAQVTALNQQITQLEERLQLLAQKGSSLEALNRDVKIAETVFSATLARLDLSRADLFGSYPQVQLVTEPSLPEGNKPLKAKLALVGALFSSFLLTAGFTTLYLRDLKTSRRRATQPLTIEYPPEMLNGSAPGYKAHQEAEPVSSKGKTDD